MTTTITELDDNGYAVEEHTYTGLKLSLDCVKNNKYINDLGRIYTIKNDYWITEDLGNTTEKNIKYLTHKQLPDKLYDIYTIGDGYGGGHNGCSMKHKHNLAPYTCIQNTNYICNGTNVPGDMPKGVMCNSKSCCCGGKSKTTGRPCTCQLNNVKEDGPLLLDPSFANTYSGVFQCGTTAVSGSKGCSNQSTEKNCNNSYWTDSNGINVTCMWEDGTHASKGCYGYNGFVGKVICIHKYEYDYWSNKCAQVPKNQQSVRCADICGCTVVSRDTKTNFPTVKWYDMQHGGPPMDIDCNDITAGGQGLMCGRSCANCDVCDCRD